MHCLSPSGGRGRGSRRGASFTLHFANLNASEMFDETAAAAAAATCDAHIDHHLRHEKKVKCLQQVREKAEQEKEGRKGAVLLLLLAMGSGQTMRHRRSQ